MFGKLSILVGIVALIWAHTWPLLGLSGLLTTVTPFNIERCKLVKLSDEFRNCEDFALLPGEPGVAYFSCDPAREFVNVVLGTNFSTPSSPPIQAGHIWRVDYSETPVKVQKIDHMHGDFHPLGLAFDGTDRLVVINIKHHDKRPAIEFFDVSKRDELVHMRTLQHSAIYNPNSIHVLQNDKYRAQDGIPSFFFTRDHYFVSRMASFLELWGMLPISHVMFYDARTDNVYPVMGGFNFPNGLAGDASTLFVAETGKMNVRQYKIVDDDDNGERIKLQFVAKVSLDMLPDNVHYLPETGDVVVAGHPKGLAFSKFAMSPPPRLAQPPSQVYVWHTCNQSVDIVFADDGKLYGGSSTATIDLYQRKLLVTGLYENGALICDMDGI